MARTLALDVGDRRIGIALSDPQGILASPVTIIERTGEGRAERAILDIIEKHAVGKIIVGLPVSMDGAIGPQATKTKSFAESLRLKTAVPIDYRDERLSTVSAMRLKPSKSKNKKFHHDAMAAAVILQSYLDETL
jgi:putative Holliday junction resolvase